MKSESDAPLEITEGIRVNEFEILNVAGSRANKDPEIFDAAYKVLKAALSGWMNPIIENHGRSYQSLKKDTVEGSDTDH